MQGEIKEDTRKQLHFLQPPESDDTSLALVLVCACVPCDFLRMCWGMCPPPRRSRRLNDWSIFTQVKSSQLPECPIPGIVPPNTFAWPGERVARNSPNQFCQCRRNLVLFSSLWCCVFYSFSVLGLFFASFMARAFFEVFETRCVCDFPECVWKALRQPVCLPIVIFLGLIWVVAYSTFPAEGYCKNKKQ